MILGGFTYAVTADYWRYLPIPILLIEGAGFTLGISLLMLLPYIFALRFAWRESNKPESYYKNIIISLTLITVALYCYGLVHHTLKYGL